MKPRSATRVLASIVVAILVAGISGAANPPGLLNYQGVLRDNLDQPLNGIYLMTFRLFDGGSGTEILVDTHGDAAGGTVVVTGGLFSVEIGSGTVTDGAGPGTYTSLDNVFRDFDHVLLRIEVEGEALSPDIRVLAAAYAQNASFLGGLHDSQFLRSDQNDTAVGNLYLAGTPSGPAISQGLLYMNPISASPTDTLLGIAVGGQEQFRIDGLGNVTVDGSIRADVPSGHGYGIHASASDGGGFFEDNDQSGEARLAVGDVGVSASGDYAGGRFVHTNAIGLAELATADHGILGYGPVSGGEFQDTDETGYARAGWGNTGVAGYGSNTGGYFEDTDGSGYAYVGFNNSGILAYGQVTAGTFSNSSGSYVYMPNGTRAIFAQGGSASVAAIQGNSLGATWGNLGADGISTGGNGSKQFVQNHPHDKGKVVRYRSLEGDEAGTYTRGSGTLKNGVARVRLGETFQWVTNPDIGLTAHVTPRGGPADLHVESVTTTELVVRGSEGSGAGFDFIVHGLRIGFEEQGVVTDKHIESMIPSMQTDRDQFQRDPALRAYTALARFERMDNESGRPVSDRSGARALEASIGRYDPAIHGPMENLLGFEHPDSETPDRSTDGNGPDVTSPPRDREPRRSTEPHRTEPSRAFSAPTTVTAPTARNEVRIGVAGTVETGDVLVLDPLGSGMLQRGVLEADPAVAGIAMGAGENGQAPVAFGGIVACKVDAGYGTVRVGDLLTVSPTPGHAMRSMDPRPGTILGKAAQSLDSGTGVIRIIVALR